MPRTSWGVRAPSPCGEAEEEPWLYVAESGVRAGEAADCDSASHPPTPCTDRSSTRLSRGTTFVSGDAPGADMAVTVGHPSLFTAWRGRPVHRESLAPAEPGLGVGHLRGRALKGRLFFSGARGPAQELIPLVQVVVHEVGNSLERLYLQERLHLIAIREGLDPRRARPPRRRAPVADRDPLAAPGAC